MRSFPPERRQFNVEDKIMILRKLKWKHFWLSSHLGEIASSLSRKPILGGFGLEMYKINHFAMKESIIFRQQSTQQSTTSHSNRNHDPSPLRYLAQRRSGCCRLPNPPLCRLTGQGSHGLGRSPN